MEILLESIGHGSLFKILPFFLTSCLIISQTWLSFFSPAYPPPPPPSLFFTPLHFLNECVKKAFHR